MRASTESDMQGSFFWYDLDDVRHQGGGPNSTGDVVGWGIQDSGNPQMDYTLSPRARAGVAG